MNTRGAALWPRASSKCRRYVREYGAIGAVGLSAASPVVIDVQLLDCLHECDPAAQTISANFDAGTVTVR